MIFSKEINKVTNPDITLHFGNDVYTSDKRNLIKIERGIYLVYSGKYNGEYVDLNKLLYIGKADKTSFKDRIQNHEEVDYHDWLKECAPGEKIYFRVASLETNIADVEAAMIFKHKPPCNEVGVDNYIGTRPAPNVDYDVALPRVDGSLIDVLDIDKKVNKR